MKRIDNDIDNMPKTPSWYFKGRKCCKCGSDKTHMDGGISPKWRSCMCNKEDCTKWLCYWCFYEIQKIKRHNEKEERLKNIKCYICGSDNTYNNWWIKYKDNKGIWDQKSYVCNKCYGREWYDSTIGPMRKCRHEDIYLKNFDDLNEKEKGRVIEDVMAEGLGVENQNVVSDDYNSPVDLTHHEERGSIQVKSRALDIDNRWKFDFENIDNYDTLCLVGLNRSFRTIEEAWMIPTDELVKMLDNKIKRESISIYKDRFSEYNEFKIDHKPYNDILQKRINESENIGKKREGGC